MDHSTQPFLRWAGSKRQLVPKLASFWTPSFQRYFEPFMGSACLFFALRPRKAVLSDANRQLVQTFRVVKKNPEKLAQSLEQLPMGRTAYYNLRSQNHRELSDVDAAARFIFLNRFCFNGLFRTNQAGEFNVPYASSKTGRLPTLHHLLEASKLFKGTRLLCEDFETVLADVGAGDFVYLDPPFAVSNRRVFRQYGPNEFGLDDLRRLASAIARIERRGAVFVLSYAYCSEALDLFRGWPTRKIFVRRNIAGFTRSRRTAAELLISNLLMP